MNRYIYYYYYYYYYYYHHQHRPKRERKVVYKLLSQPHKHMRHSK